MLVGSQRPRVWSAPPAVSSAGAEAIEVAKLAGLHLDEAQQFVLQHAMGERADGKWAAFEVGVCESRQNGKGGILEARELASLYIDDLPDRLIIHSAHLFDTSLEAFMRMESLIGSSEELSRRVKSVSRSHGSEGFTLFNGKRLRYRPRTGGGGRGFTGDVIVFDEAMDLPEKTIGALMPVLSTVPNPQIWYTGSAVDQLEHQNGLVFSRVRERGRKGDDPSMCWFEWSLDYDTPDDVPKEVLTDPEAWAQANPAFGIRISAEYIANEQRSMSPRTFSVERLGVGDWPAPDGSVATVLKLDDWRALTDTDSVIPDPVCLAFDVTPDRAWASIAVAARRDDGMWHVEVVDRRRGTDWVSGRLVELKRHHPFAWICDGSGPAASLIPELEREEGLVVTTASAQDNARACGFLFDAVEQKTLRHLGSAELEAAVRGATKRPLGDTWAWSRKNSAVDISPLVAVTLALWGASGLAELEVPVMAAWG